MSRKIYVLDTNIILQDISNVFRLSDGGTNTIVIADTVLTELEDKKKLTNEIGFYSREFARLLAKMDEKNVDFQDGFKVMEVVYDSLIIHIISKDKYTSKTESAHINESNDKRIIEVAQLCKDYYKGLEVTFVSLDIYARTFALFGGIQTQTLHDDKADVPDFEFVKNINLDSIYFNGLDNQNIVDVDPEHKPENFCYEFSSNDGHTVYGIVQNGKIIKMEESDFNGIYVKPVNLKQKFFVKAILSNLFNIVVVEAKAGTGKTLVAFTAAMKLIDQGKYDKIIYVRNSIESLDKGADVGYLAGNDEKFRIYNMALYDTLEFVVKKQIKKGDVNSSETIKEKTEALASRYAIETLWPGEARGRTLSGSIVIMDEWQNSSEKTTQLILSRLDESCMAVVIGSNRQIDNFYLNKFNNGLTTLLKHTKTTHPELSLFAVDLEKAVRGKFAEFAERIFEKKITQS